MPVSVRKLREFITQKMVMSHIYQPVMLRTLIGKGGEEYEWCLHTFRSVASWWPCQLLSAWPAVWLGCCLQSRKHLPLLPWKCTCRNRPIELCNNLPWRCCGFFFFFLLVLPVFDLFSSVSDDWLTPFFSFVRSFYMAGLTWMSRRSDMEGVKIESNFILWATGRLLWVQLLLLVIAFHA